MLLFEERVRPSDIEPIERLNDLGPCDRDFAIVGVDRLGAVRDLWYDLQGDPRTAQSRSRVSVQAKHQDFAGIARKKKRQVQGSAYAVAVDHERGGFSLMIVPDGDHDSA